MFGDFTVTFSLDVFYVRHGPALEWYYASQLINHVNVYTAVLT